MLMITGNNLWNNKSRLISKDEFGLLGMPQKKNSYFAPVYRSNENLVPTNINYSQHRIIDLIKEFK